MKFTVHIEVMPKKALLDPQGKAINTILHNTDYEMIDDVRIGKHITLTVEADTKEKASAIVDEISKTVLSNPVMEDYSFVIE
jgi:phosphoribosylformylglycinamidine synthase